TGEAAHPYIGVQMVDLTAERRDQINQAQALDVPIQSATGVLILKVLEGTPAEEAGLKPGDILMRINDTEIETATDVQQQVENSTIGQTLKIEIRRSDALIELDLLPISLPDEPFG
ncbi:PDZ domain-containing protein, partial [Okeania sp. SIO2G5]|uniref:PDZ domain-containing protein n=1 Tax=Okeania sp. SIO2G5 TaxID=2607796 RepID=UPI0013C03282